MSMPNGLYDPRAIANLLLDYAESGGLQLRHIALQKLLYFAHATFLVQRGQPLVKGPFEAWQYGPVHPTIYQSFKVAGGKPIDFRAKARDVLTGVQRDVEMPDDPDVRLHVMQVVASYGRLSTSRLIHLSHLKGGPWDQVVSATSSADGGLVYGERIADDVIRAFFARPSVGFKADSLPPETDEPDDEAEPAPPDRYSQLRGP